MRIDAHQHFWHYDAAEYGWIDSSMSAIARNFLPAHSAPEMAAINVDASGWSTSGARFAPAWQV